LGVYKYASGSLQGFVEGFMKNKLQPYYKSQAIPEPVTLFCFIIDTFGSSASVSKQSSSFNERCMFYVILLYLTSFHAGMLVSMDL
jgi:hypothetical protein